MMKCEKCRREMVEVGSFAFVCWVCDESKDGGGGIKPVM